jgi:hypothetical protein
MQNIVMIWQKKLSEVEHKKRAMFYHKDDISFNTGFFNQRSTNLLIRFVGNELHGTEILIVRQKSHNKKMATMVVPLLER